MKKRGQVTVFIILGIIILLSVVAFISIKSWIITQEANVEEQKTLSAVSTGEATKSYVESCIESTTRNAILDNSLSGGYFVLPKKSTTNLFDNVPYYYQNKNDLYPTNNVIAEEIAQYVDEMLFLCINDFRTFREQGYEIASQNPVSEASISPQKIILRTNFPITIQIGTITKDISDFIVEVTATEFYQDILTAREMVKNQEGDKICLTCLSNLAVENDLFINILPSIENTYIIDITDNNYIINEQNYRLRFALQFDEITE